MPEHRTTAAPPLMSAERMKSFTDAVVAIAMTLLILPLMESAGGVETSGKTAGEWFSAERWSLLSFALSFGLIAMFWVYHHQLFANVRFVDGGLLWLTIAWMFSIVWLPVVTSLQGDLTDGEPQRLVYIASMLLVSLLLVTTARYLRAHPVLHNSSSEDLAAGIRGGSVAVSLFLVAFVVSWLVPRLGYSALFVLCLNGPIQALIERRVAPKRGTPASAAGDEGVEVSEP